MDSPSADGDKHPADEPRFVYGYAITQRAKNYSV